MLGRCTEAAHNCVEFSDICLLKNGCGDGGAGVPLPEGGGVHTVYPGRRGQLPVLCSLHNG